MTGVGPISTMTSSHIPSPRCPIMRYVFGSSGFVSLHGEVETYPASNIAFFTASILLPPLLEPRLIKTSNPIERGLGLAEV